ncbi:MAG TPA: dCMP deaminase family protein [Candidatus Aenigmarchaeota archaeon]|nr:dCMP deaminase family protein [Candidatus Aenigmarchaeota archaeon]
MNRPSKDDYYLNIAREVCKRGTCLRRRYGAVIVKDDQIISTGYVGAPRGTPNCIDLGVCKREELKIPKGERYELCRSVHAEMNAIINAARAGVSVLGGTLYLYGEEVKDGSLTEPEPCKLCQRAIINAGLKKVVLRTKDGGIRVINVEDWVKSGKI